MPQSTQLPKYEHLWQKTLQWQPTDEQQACFQQLYEKILAGNRQLNLTRITTPDEFWEKHLWDSLSGIAPWLQNDTYEQDGSPSDSQNASPIKVIDIGTGGGFPGVPAAIALARTGIELTLLDSTRKKISFLQQLTEQLNIPSVCIAERAEALGRQSEHRAQYDLVLVRAVGPASTCLEYALPLLAIGGQAVLFRGQWHVEDTEALLPVVELLGGELTDLQSWNTPLTQSERNCLFIHKIKPTPEDFPRAVGVPAKSPLT